MLLPSAQKILEILLIQAQNHRLAHAYLFLGPKGANMENVVYEFAKNILSLKSRTDTAHTPFTHPDFLEFKVDPENEKEAQQIRQFTEKMFLKPMVAKSKIVFIPHLDQLNWYSSNALLKVVEEPAPDTCIFLTAHTRKLLPTIMSRCQIFNFNSPKSVYPADTTTRLPSVMSFLGKSLAERLNAVNVFAELEDNEFLLTLENFVYLVSERLAQLPEQYGLLGVGLKALEEFNTNKNKKFIMQGVMLKI